MSILSSQLSYFLNKDKKDWSWEQDKDWKQCIIGAKEPNKLKVDKIINPEISKEEFKTFWKEACIEEKLMKKCRDNWKYKKNIMWFRKALFFTFQELQDDYKIYKDLTNWLYAWDDTSLSSFMRKLWTILECLPKQEHILTVIYWEIDKIPPIFLKNPWRAISI